MIKTYTANANGLKWELDVDTEHPLGSQVLFYTDSQVSGFIEELVSSHKITPDTLEEENAKGTWAILRIAE